jgi:hypothetical protein
MNAHLEFDVAAGPAVAHFVAGLALQMRRNRWSVSTNLPAQLDPGGNGPALVGDRAVVLFNQPVHGNAVSGRLNDTLIEVPFAVAAETFGCPGSLSSERPRLLFWADDPAGRRTRMTVKVIAELRRRGRSVTAVSFGSISDELIRIAAPDEVHEDLDAAEFSSMFCCSTAILETCDHPEMCSPALTIARCIGIPAISHREAGLHADVNVDEWSADAFADAIQSLPHPSRAVPDEARLRHAAAELEKVLRGDA